MKPLKSGGVSKIKQAHSSPKKKGSPDSYGSGVKNPVGKMKRSALDFGYVTPKELKKPPKSLA